MARKKKKTSSSDPGKVGVTTHAASHSKNPSRLSRLGWINSITLVSSIVGISWAVYSLWISPLQESKDLAAKISAEFIRLIKTIVVSPPPRNPVFAPDELLSLVPEKLSLTNLHNLIFTKPGTLPENCSQSVSFAYDCLEQYEQVSSELVLGLDNRTGEIVKPINPEKQQLALNLFKKMIPAVSFALVQIEMTYPGSVRSASLETKPDRSARFVLMSISDSHLDYEIMGYLPMTRGNGDVRVSRTGDKVRMTAVFGEAVVMPNGNTVFTWS